MGVYINPKNMSKEQWLAENAVEVKTNEKGFDLMRVVLADEELKELEGGGHLPVVLVDNGPFTAAGIAYSKRELEAFTDERDLRPKRFFIVPIHKLLKVSPELKGYMEMEERMKNELG